MNKLNETRCNYVISYIYFFHQRTRYKTCISLVNIIKYYKYLETIDLSKTKLIKINQLIEDCNDLLVNCFKMKSKALNKQIEEIEMKLGEVLKDD